MLNDSQKKSDTSSAEPQDEIRDLEPQSIPDQDAENVTGGRITNVRGNASPLAGGSASGASQITP